LKLLIWPGHNAFTNYICSVVGFSGSLFFVASFFFFLIKKRNLPTGRQAKKNQGRKDYTSFLPGSYVQRLYYCDFNICSLLLNSKRLLQGKMLTIQQLYCFYFITSTCKGASFGSVPPKAGFDPAKSGTPLGDNFSKEAKAAPMQVRGPAGRGGESNDLKSSSKRRMY